MSINNSLKLFYNTVLSQTFSPDGNFLVAADIYGNVSLFEVSKILGPQKSQSENELQGPSYSFLAHPEHRIECMITTNDFLITGSTGEISGWDWKTITSSKVSKAKSSWTIPIMQESNDSFERPDATDMVYSKANHTLFAACGNDINKIDLEYGKITDTFKSHQDYIHSISLLNNSLASAGEDGSVQIWDCRKKEVTDNLHPYVSDRVGRPRFGKWIGAVDFTDDWLLCGGGPRLSLWSTRTMDVCTIFDLPDQGIHVAKIYDERIIAGGQMPNVYHLNYQGDTLAKIPVSSNVVYSVAYQKSPREIVSIAGSSNNLDICTNFNYREFVIKFA